MPHNASDATAPALTPLRGRAAEWRLVTDAMARLAHRRRSIVTVEGRPGMGRTRFLRELALAAGQAGCVVVTYDWDDEVREPEPLHVLAVPAGIEPIVIIADDAPPIDHLLRPSLRVNADAPVLWVTTRSLCAQPDEADTAVGTIELGPLAPDAVALVVADLLGVPAGLDVLALAGAAAGHPDSLVELVSGLVDEGLLALGDRVARLTATALPARSRDRIRRRLDRVSADARILVQVASVVGGPGGPGSGGSASGGSASGGAADPAGQVSLNDVARLLRTNVAALVPAVEEALASGLLVTVGERLGFGHPLVRQEVAGSLSPAIRRGLRTEFAEPGPAFGAPWESDVDQRGPKYQTPQLNRPGVLMNIGLVDPTGTAGRDSAPAGTQSPRPAPLSRWSELTEREREIATLVSEGLTNPEIAGRLYVSKDTVAYHLKSVFRKLGVSRRTQLAGLVRR